MKIGGGNVGALTVDGMIGMTTIEGAKSDGFGRASGVYESQPWALPAAEGTHALYDGRSSQGHAVVEDGKALVAVSTVGAVRGLALQGKEATPVVHEAVQLAPHLLDLFLIEEYWLTAPSKHLVQTDVKQGHCRDLHQ